MTRVLADAFGIDTTIPENNLDNPDLLERLYPELNIEAIGVGFNIDLYLIVGNFSNIIEFMDIVKGKNIGILADSYYFFLKICMAYGLSMDILNNITNNGNTIEPTLEILIENFQDSVLTQIQTDVLNSLINLISIPDL